VVGFAASAASALGLFDLEFWWELALLIVIMVLGHWLEMRALGQASGALDALAALLPDEADRVAGDRVETVPVADLAVGDLVLVRPGGRVPADGVVTDGEAELEESMITGESRPVARGPGDRVVAGTVVTDTAVRVRVDAVGEGTALAGIRRLVSQAQASGSRAQALADRAAALLFWFALGAGLVTAVVWLALGEPDQAVERTVTVLVIACPHALGLAIPLVIAISTALAARNGILVKDRLALERMRTVDAVLFDKTGTLIEGRPGAGRAAGGHRVPGHDRPRGPGNGRRRHRGRRRPGPAAPAGADRAGGAGRRAGRPAGPGRGLLYVVRDDKVVGALSLEMPSGPSRARPWPSCTAWASGW
jgi:P-type Cu2+ transporter